jgi:hypothetical protein
VVSYGSYKLFEMGTFQYEPGVPPCDAGGGLRTLPPNGMYLRMREEPLSEDLPRRPTEFRLSQFRLDRYDGISCRRVYLVMFEDNGRFFVLHLAFGARAPESLRRKILEVLDTLRVESRELPCTPRSHNTKQADTRLGQWLVQLLESVGAPEGWSIARERIAEPRQFRGSGFLLQLPQYEERFNVGLFAETPDVLNVEIDEIPVMARWEKWTLHAGWVRKGPPSAVHRSKPGVVDHRACVSRQGAH